MNEEEKSVFHLPTNIAPVEQISYSDSFSRTEDKISDKDLFNELDVIPLHLRLWLTLPCCA